MDDSKIVELYLQRDETAISETEKKYGAMLRRIAARILNDELSAEECENDTYLQAWTLIPPNELRTYLFPFLGRITRHIAIDRCRKRGSEKRSAAFCELTDEITECIPASGISVEKTVESSQLSETINEFLRLCSEDRRNVFVRRYWFFETVPEISKRYGYSQSKVKMMLSRMRCDLRDHLERNGYQI